MTESGERLSLSKRQSRRDAMNSESWSLNSSASLGSRKKKKWVALECNCGTHAVLFMSRMELNLTRLFFGCPYFKTSTLHCKYFAWLDEYVSSFNEDASKNFQFGGLNQKEVRFEGHSHSVHDKAEEFEKILAGLEVELYKSRVNKIQSRCSGVGCIVIAFVAGVVIANILRDFE